MATRKGYELKTFHCWKVLAKSPKGNRWYAVCGDTVKDALQDLRNRFPGSKYAGTIVNDGYKILSIRKEVV